MNKKNVLEIFKKTGALLEGHFLLTSGLHSPHYFQCAKVLQYPTYTELLCQEIADHFINEKIDLVISPAVGGIVVGQEVARLLGCRAIFAERSEGKMTLRRGFEIHDNENILCVEDVVTTGGSIKEIIQIARMQANVKGAAFIVDRSAGKVDFGIPRFAVLEMEVTTFEPSLCPLCKEGLELVKPGSRNIK